MSANEKLRDEEVAHILSLDKYSNGVVRRILSLLNRVDADLFAQLTAALDRLPADSFTVERLERLLISVRKLNLEAYEQAGQALTDELSDFVEYEAGFRTQTLTAAMPAQVVAQIEIASVNVGQVYSAAMARPFQGRLLSEWAESIAADRMKRIRDALRMGYVENQTVAQMVQRVRGTRAKGYADGIIEIDRRNAEAMVRTAISHTAAVTRDAFIDANADLVKAVQWVSTLDNRTSSPCRLRDGLKYTHDTHKPVGHKVLWGAGPGALHWCCRSTCCPVLKSWRELGISIDDVDAGDRSSMDGQVAADMTYSEWLVKQSPARQDEILGASRGRLLRSGKVKPGDFYSNKGVFLTLDQLRERDAAAFA